MMTEPCFEDLHQWHQVDAETERRIRRRITRMLGFDCSAGYVVMCDVCGVQSWRDYEDFDVWSARRRPVLMPFPAAL